MTTRADIRAAVFDHLIRVADDHDKALLEGARARGDDVAISELKFDSLDAVDLCMAIEKRMGIAVDVAELARVTTIDGFVERVGILAGVDEVEEAPTAAPDIAALAPHVILLRDGDPRATPVFLIHGGDGSVFAFRFLLARLKGDFAVYGVQMHGVEGGDAPRQTMEEMVRDCIGAITAVRPYGPHLLVGYSSGGVLAYEAGCELDPDGLNGSIVAMLDTHSPARSYAEFSAPERAALLASQTWRNFRKKIRCSMFESQATKLWAKGERLPPDVRARYFKAVVTVAQSAFVPRAYRGRLVMFRASATRAAYMRGDPAMGWREHARGPLQVVDIDATHGTIVKEPAVADVAARLGELFAPQRVPETA